MPRSWSEEAAGFTGHAPGNGEADLSLSIFNSEQLEFLERMVSWPGYTCASQGEADVKSDFKSKRESRT